MPYPRVGFAWEGGPRAKHVTKHRKAKCEKKQKRCNTIPYLNTRSCGGRCTACMMYVYRMVQVNKCVRARVSCPVNHTHGVRSLALPVC
eukprot:2363902-Prymnesium_polylepis.1